MKQSRSEFIDLHGVRHHVRRWGDPEAPTLFMLHGWQDMSATYQAVVDHFSTDLNVIAPDWRGFGLSDWGSDPYYLTEYVLALDELLDLYSPAGPACIVGHSMGGNVTGLYAGTRPDRVARFVNIEGYAPVPGFGAESVSEFLGRWLKHRRTPAARQTYPDRETAVQFVARLYPRRTGPEIEFLTTHLTHERPDGRWELNADPRSRFVLAMPLSTDQVTQLWSSITAEVLCLRGTLSFVSKAFEERLDVWQARLGCLRRGREILVEGAGHNVHQDRPAEVAELIEEFVLHGFADDASRTPDCARLG